MNNNDKIKNATCVLDICDLGDTFDEALALWIKHNPKSILAKKTRKPVVALSKANWANINGWL